MSVLFQSFFICTTAQKGSIKGTVKDSLTGEALQLASVAVYIAKQISLITYQLSDKEGTFDMRSLPLNVICRVVVTYQGYKVYRREFDLSRDNSLLSIGSINLAALENKMEEVIVVTERPPKPYETIR